MERVAFPALLHPYHLFYIDLETMLKYTTSDCQEQSCEVVCVSMPERREMGHT